jgi:cell division protein DivIC
MKNIKNKSFLKNVLLIGIMIYVIYTFFTQQKMLNEYQADQKRYSEQITEAKEQQEELKTTKENINSKEYIEEVAREKLDMYLPNERVYIDISK